MPLQYDTICHKQYSSDTDDSGITGYRTKRTETTFVKIQSCVDDNTVIINRPAELKLSESI